MSKSTGNNTKIDFRVPRESMDTIALHLYPGHSKGDEARRIVGNYHELMRQTRRRLHGEGRWPNIRRLVPVIADCLERLPIDHLFQVLSVHDFLETALAKFPDIAAEHCLDTTAALESVRGLTAAEDLCLLDHVHAWLAEQARENREGL